MPKTPMTQMTRRRAGQTALTAAEIGALAGCTPTASAPAAPAQARPGGEVRFLTWSVTWNEPMGPKFQEYTANTGTKVTLEWETQADHDAKVTAGLASDTAPDLILSVSQIDTKFYDAGAMLNLSPYVQRDKLNLRRDYALMGTEYWCGKIYGLPWHAASSASTTTRRCSARRGSLTPGRTARGSGPGTTWPPSPAT